MLSKRLSSLPKYLFVKIEERKHALLAKGCKVLDFGVGDPDIPVPTPIRERLSEYANSSPSGYPPGEGLAALKEAISEFYKRKYNVSLDPETEVLPLIGSKEGIAHLPLALLDVGDVAFVPDPAYPVYEAATCIAGGRVQRIALLKENDFLPDISSLPQSLMGKVKLFYINYPNNPTGAIATRQFFKELLSVAQKWGFVVCQDAAYAQIVFEGRPFSILELDEARECCIEFGSLSKSHSMAGWRIGFAVGAPSIVQALRKVKSNIDSGIPWAVQHAACFALSRECDHLVEQIVEEYKRRVFAFAEGLKKMGFSVNEPLSTFYLWVPISEGFTSESFCSFLAEKAHIIATPGVGFGKCGEGYARFALTKPMDEIEEALERIRRYFG